MRTIKTRLKWYKRQSDGFIISEPMLIGSEVVRYYINPQTNVALMKDINEKYLFGIVKGEGINDLKRKIKQRAKSLGAKFNEEIRNKELAKLKKAKKQAAAKQKAQIKERLPPKENN